VKTRNCRYVHCGAPLPDSHGNTQYCPGTDCDYLAKLARQSKNYEIGDNAKKAIQKNHALFLKVLGEGNHIELDLLYLLKLGFNQDGYYGIGVTKTTQKKVFIVHDCYFHITSNTPQKIEIWRTSKI
jgi:hypothetical protein